jgi:outer membrane protein OmpA-like peptidoglycan-associated protein
VKFLFNPDSTAFWPDPAISGPYPMWLRAIADRAAADGACLRLTGHASPTGSVALNDQLSLARAQRIERDLVHLDPELRGRLEARGVGSRDPIVGTGADNATDALDRRVDFQPVSCLRLQAAA